MSARIDAWLEAVRQHEALWAQCRDAEKTMHDAMPVCEHDRETLAVAIRMDREIRIEIVHHRHTLSVGQAQALAHWILTCWPDPTP
jgi:hypothetical protein